MIAWARQQARTYLGNAGSVRDFRTQLRGNRAPIYFTIYLFILFLFSITAYLAIERAGGQSVSSLQAMLYGYYLSILSTLEGLVMLVAPVLAATSIVAEHQRRSMELLLSAPVTPKYFFVGKLISGYRYVWMLLALSIPITATCVVLGGATWGEVLEAYVILSLHALVYTAIALPIGMMAQKAVGAVIWSLLAVGAYAGVANIVGFSLGGLTAMTSAMGVGGPPTQELPPWMTLAPFSSMSALGTYTTLWGAPVPNWLLSIGIHLLIVKLIVLGAGSAMGRFGAPETKGLRIYGLILLGILTWIMSYNFAIAARGSFGMGGSGGVDPTGHFLAMQVVIPSVFLMPFVPHLLCWAGFADKKYAPDRLLVLRHAFKGGSGGGVPYLMICLAMILLVISVSYGLAGVAPTSLGLSRIGWALSAWLVIVAGARLSSAVSTGELDTSRKLFVVFMIAWMLMPLPVLLILDAVMQTNPGETGTWVFYGLSGIFVNGPDIILGSSIVNAALGAILLYSAEQKRRARGLIEVSQLS